MSNDWNNNDDWDAGDADYGESHQNQGGFPTWIIWIVALLGINLLSWILDWGFVLY